MFHHCTIDRDCVNGVHIVCAHNEVRSCLAWICGRAILNDSYEYVNTVIPGGRKGNFGKQFDESRMHDPNPSCAM